MRCPPLAPKNESGCRRLSRKDVSPLSLFERRVSRYRPKPTSAATMPPPTANPTGLSSSKEPITPGASRAGAAAADGRDAAAVTTAGALASGLTGSGAAATAADAAGVGLASIARAGAGGTATVGDGALAGMLAALETGAGTGTTGGTGTAGAAGAAPPEIRFSSSTFRDSSATRASDSFFSRSFESLSSTAVAFALDAPLLKVSLSGAVAAVTFLSSTVD